MVTRKRTSGRKKAGKAGAGTAGSKTAGRRSAQHAPAIRIERDSAPGDTEIVVAVTDPGTPVGPGTQPGPGTQVV
jgi:hypothetical protein